MTSFKFKMCIFVYIWKLVNLVSLAHQRARTPAHHKDPRPIYVQILSFLHANLDLCCVLKSMNNLVGTQPADEFSLSFPRLHKYQFTVVAILPTGAPSKNWAPHNDGTHLDDQKSMENPFQVETKSIQYNTSRPLTAHYVYYVSHSFKGWNWSSCRPCGAAHWCHTV